jgi:hypothetical protein
MIQITVWFIIVNQKILPRLNVRMIGIRIPAEAGNFSVQTDSGAHPASNSLGTGGCFLGSKAAGSSS